MLVVPLSGAMGIDELAAFGAIFGFSGGVILLFSSLFLPGSSQPIQAFPERVKNKPTEIGKAGSPRAFLNDIHSTSTDYIQPSDLHNDESLNTGKLKVQISVTEHTTKLLSKEELDK